MPARHRADRDPARRRPIPRNHGDLCEHRGPGAADARGPFAEGRGARRLGHHPRAVGRMSARRCRMTACVQPAAREDGEWIIRNLSPASTSRRAPWRQRFSPPYGVAWRLAVQSAMPFGQSARLQHFHLTNAIARASRTMAECAELAAGTRPRKWQRNRRARCRTSLTWGAGDWGHSIGLAVLQILDSSSWSAGVHRLPAAVRPQDLGGGADAQGPERGGPVRPVAVVRRPRSSSC